MSGQPDEPLDEALALPPADLPLLAERIARRLARACPDWSPADVAALAEEIAKRQERWDERERRASRPWARPDAPPAEPDA